jgi:hypothetical protein
VGVEVSNSEEECLRARDQDILRLEWRNINVFLVCQNQQGSRVN